MRHDSILRLKPEVAFGKDFSLLHCLDRQGFLLTYRSAIAFEFRLTLGEGGGLARIWNGPTTSPSPKMLKRPDLPVPGHSVSCPASAVEMWPVIVW
jgi:hypothetical protein